LDTRDRAYFSTKGSKLNIRAEYVIPVSQNWTSNLFKNATIIYGSWSGNLPFGKRKKFVFQPGAFAGFTLNAKNIDLPPINHWFGLGGLNNFNYQDNIVPFMGTKFIQAWGLHSVVARLGLQYNVYKKLYLTFRDDMGTIWGLEDNTANADNIELDIINGFGLSVGYDSFIGPAELTFMGSNVYGFSVFLSVGFWF
jgi:outer membrane protein assembly factor BamA